MDDLEQAILISFDGSGAINSGLKEQAAAFIQQIKNNPSVYSVCIEKLRFSNLVQVQFWCLQCLHESLRFKYSSMTMEEKSFIRKSIFSMACSETVVSNGSHLVEGPAFLKNKLAQVIVTLIYFEYPQIWPSVFVDFLPNLSKGAGVIDMLARILNVMDDELISMDYPRDADGVAVSGRIKDAMRAQCVPQIVAAWYDIVLVYKISNPSLCICVLDSLRRFVSWIDISLITGDAFIRLLFELILVDMLPDQLRAAAVGVILAVTSKRMDYKSKLALLQTLQIRRVLGLVFGDSDSELVSSTASLVTGYAMEVLECYRRLSAQDGKGIALELLNEVMSSVFHVMQNGESDLVPSIMQFLSGYVSTMRTPAVLTETQTQHLSKMLEVMRSQIQFDPVYRSNLEVLDKIGKEEQDKMQEFRKDFFVLLRNIGHVAPDLTHLFIRNSFAAVITSSNPEEAEACLSLFYAFGESLKDEALRASDGLLRELIPLLLTTRFSCHSNRLVALVYLDTISRYMKFVSENMQYIPMALRAFLDERGIHHSDINVSRRGSYLFARVVRLLKAQLVPYIETILQSLEDMVSQFTRMKEASKDLMKEASKDLSGSEDGSHIFEAIGLLIGMEEIPLEKQSDYLSALLTPLCQQVEAALLNAKSCNWEESFTEIDNMQQIIMAINALSKGFSERLVTASRPGIGLMFGKTLDILLQILVVFPKIEPLRSKVVSFMHRMVDTLGVLIFPYLPKALGQLLTESEPKELENFLVLLNQLIGKFGTEVREILEETYPVITGRVFNILPKNDILSGPGSCAEEIRELLNLQKTFFTFLHIIATHDLSSVFLSYKSSGYLHLVMELLLQTCCNHADTLVRKACVQIFIRLIKDWCDGPGPEKVPGFRSFIIEAFAIRCCLYSVLDKSFEFRNVNNGLLFGEIVTAQKVMYDKLGSDFLVHFATKGLPSAHCPQNLAEQYCLMLQGSDVMSLKSFYQSLVEQLRTLQNGNLFFR